MTNLTTSLYGGTAKTVPDVINVKTGRADPFAGHLGKDTFAGLASYGCSWCREEVIYDVPGVSVFLNDDTILCPECSGNHGRNRIVVSAIDMSDIEDLISITA